MRRFVARLDASFEGFINLEGMVAISKRMNAAVAYLEEVIVDIRDMDLIDLDAFIADETIRRNSAHAPAGSTSNSSDLSLRKWICSVAQSSEG